MKEKFIKETIILIIGGLLTKILGMVIKIITTRIVGINAIGLYSLVMPTYGLLITIATLSLPIAISKLVAENTRKNKNIVLGVIPIAMLFNVILIIITITMAKPLANGLLQNKDLYYPLIAISITLPFITLSNIIRGYFFGKEQMIPHVVSNLTEQIIRIAITILLTPHLLKYGIVSTVTGLILFNITSELTSIIVLVLFMPKNSKIRKQDIKPVKDDIKDILNISIPTTAGRIISGVGNFLEPVIITYVLLKLGYDTNYITKEYGIITGLILPLVTLPQFISAAIAQALLPTLSKYNAQNMKKAINRKLKQALLISLVIGIISSLMLIIFPKQALHIMFKTEEGYKYLALGAITFLITYVEAPIISTLQALDKAKTIMKANLIGTIIKTITLFILLYLDISMYALLISTLLQHTYITIIEYKKIKETLA